MISIIIPVYNQADKIGKCLDSILNQTYRDFEVTIINDGSTDNIDKVLNKYKIQFQITNHKLQIINQTNLGSNPARNRGAKEAKGDYLLFCDADIIIEPEMLKMMIETLNKAPNASFAYSSFKYGLKTFKLWPYDAERLKKMPYIHTTSLIRREHFPGWDENIKRLQDWDLWLTMLEQGHTGVWIDKILFKVQTGGIISTWLPSFVYKFMPFLPQVKKYKQAKKVIKEKHKL